MWWSSLKWGNSSSDRNRQENEHIHDGYGGNILRISELEHSRASCWSGVPIRVTWGSQRGKSREQARHPMRIAAGDSACQIADLDPEQGAVFAKVFESPNQQVLHRIGNSAV